MRKGWICVLALCCVLAALPSVPARAAGDASVVHDIYTAADLAEMADKDGTYYLRNDLDLANYGNWTPINFSGTFDGMGHTIRGVVVSGYEGENVGFFDTLSGTVKNVSFAVDVRGHYNVDIQGYEKKNTFVGGVVGKLDSGANIERVSVSGQVRMTCNFETGHSGSYVNVGGLVGGIYGWPPIELSISNCYSDVTVTLSMSGNSNELSYSFCGGLAGSISTITNSYASGQVILSGLTLNEAYERQVYCDGFVGRATNVRRSYYCNLRNSNLNSGAAYLTEGAMTQQSSFANWDFSNIWAISPDVNNGFPYLRGPEETRLENVSLDLSTLTLRPGAAQMLQASIQPVNATNRHLDWYTSDETVVRLTPVTDETCGEPDGVINPRIMVNAVSPGVAVVTAVATDGQIQAACTVTVSDGSPPAPPPYRLNGITVTDTNGNALNAIPAGPFLATVSVTNIASEDRPVIALTSYSEAGQYEGLFYVTLKSPVGGTIEATIPIDNTDGRISRLRAFAVTSMAELRPLDGVASFPAG